LGAQAKFPASCFLGRHAGKGMDRGAPEGDENGFERHTDARDGRGHIEREDQLEHRCPRGAFDAASRVDSWPSAEVLDGPCGFDLQLWRAEHCATRVVLRG